MVFVSAKTAFFFLFAPVFFIIDESQLLMKTVALFLLNKCRKYTDGCLLVHVLLQPAE